MKFLSRIFDENLQDNETYYDNSFTWELQEKIEYDLLLTDDSKIINYSVVDAIALIVIETDNPITLSFSTATNSMDFEIDKQFIFTPTEAMQNNLTSFSVTEELLNSANVKIRIYGEPLES